MEIEIYIQEREEKYKLSLREDFRCMFYVEAGKIFCSIQRSIILVGSCKHGDNQTTCARTSNYIKVICYSCIFSIQFLLKSVSNNQKSKYKLNVYRDNDLPVTILINMSCHCSLGFHGLGTTHTHIY